MARTLPSFPISDANVKAVSNERAPLSLPLIVSIRFNALLPLALALAQGSPGMSHLLAYRLAARPHFAAELRLGLAPVFDHWTTRQLSTAQMQANIDFVRWLLRAYQLDE